MTPYKSSSLRSCEKYTLTFRQRKPPLASPGYSVNHQMTVHLGAPPANESLAPTTSLQMRLKPQSDRSHRTRTSLPRLSSDPRTARRQSCIDGSLKAWPTEAAAE